ncbi:hypothetical protein QAD02_002386 [Eretmocerus hayati]|uniref:Uncharacterized protein n=1 Tax=Eretmocerus hayati TaxID=131215 RepID=A0ACC2NLM9_9HYME|nr:hypothetical protein QAD02_002386 [Eretmocerus hayati]
MSTSKQSLDSGVRKSFILGLVESCQENYENISKLWSLVGLNNVPGKYSVDLKVANLLAGIMAHGAAFPCTWCYAPRGCLWKECPDVRTIGNIEEIFSLWEKPGSIKASCKKFKNCIHEPIFAGNPEEPVINSILLPQLHFFGSYKHCVRAFTQEYAPDCNGMG